MLLAQAVDAADALFDAHGVPRHVVIDQRAAELEIQPLRRCVGAEQKVGFAFVKPARAVRV